VVGGCGELLFSVLMLEIFQGFDSVWELARDLDVCKFRGDVKSSRGRLEYICGGPERGSAQGSKTRVQRSRKEACVGLRKST